MKGRWGWLMKMAFSIFSTFVRIGSVPMVICWLTNAANCLFTSPATIITHALHLIISRTLGCPVYMHWEQLQSCGWGTTTFWTPSTPLPHAGVHMHDLFLPSWTMTSFVMRITGHWWQGVGEQITPMRGWINGLQMSLFPDCQGDAATAPRGDMTDATVHSAGPTISRPMRHGLVHRCHFLI